MKTDEIGLICRKDNMILRLGASLYRRYRNDEKHTRYNVISGMIVTIDSEFLFFCYVILIFIILPKFVQSSPNLVEMLFSMIPMQCQNKNSKFEVFGYRLGG